MVFGELALYGIRNFTQLTRLAFKPGLNLIQGGNGAGKSTVRDALLAVLSPISQTPVQYLKSLKSPDTCQAALIFKTSQGRVYRLVRDFIGQRSSLAELDASNKFRVMMQEEEPIAKFLSDAIGGLGPKTLEGLFSISVSWMPSARGVAADRSRSFPASSGPLSSSIPSSEARNIPLDRAQKQKRLDELKAMLVQGDRLAAMEDQVAELQSRSAELKRRTRVVTEKTAELARLAQKGSSFESMRDFPEDHQSILETSAQQEQLKNEQLTAIAEDEEFLKQEVAAIPNQPFFQHQFFMTGGALVLVSLILLLALDLGGILQSLLMVVMLTGTGLMGYAGYLDFGKQNKRKGLEHKLRDLDRRRARVEAAFKKENAPCIELLKKAGCADVASLQEKVKAYEQFLMTRRQLETERDHLLGGKTADALQQELDSVTRQISEVEAKLKAATTLPSDLYMIQEEVRILERELLTSPATDSKPNPDPLLKVAGPDDRYSLNLPDAGNDILSAQFRSGLLADSVRSALLKHRAELQTEMIRLIGKMGGPVESGIGLNEELMPVLSSPAQTAVSWDALSSGEQDLYHLVHQFAVSRILAEAYPFPFILDNPLSVLDPLRQRKTLDILREIAQNRQVLLLSSVPYPNREDDHLIMLK
ncbi:MAG: AAA family ATPase [Nitrospirae bacterium]|nr:AAA family ATPase [Nitrospirota bacterium]